MIYLLLGTVLYVSKFAQQWYANNSGWGEEIFEFFSDAKDAGPIEFLLRIKDCNNWNIEEVGNFSCPDLS